MKGGMKTIKFYTLGCKVNQYDTQRMREQFASAGFKELENGRGADIYVINTCTVTHRADSDSLMFVRKSRRQNPKARIMVTGCLSELNEERIKDIDKKVIIVKNREKEYITRHLKLSKSVESGRGISCFKGHTRAFLKIQDGCDNLCSYCKVPLVRGSCRSKPLEEIIREAELLAQNGFKEIVLTGICLGAYGKDLSGKINLVDVIRSLEKIDWILRIRLSSIEAGDVSAELIRRIARSKKVCRHLHIPIQSGDNQILRRMNRKYRRDDYLRLIRKIKKNIPGIAITTDCMVGFPGETEANFSNTVELIKKILPLKVHIFPYSKREETLAAKKYNAQVDPSLVKERVSRLKVVSDGCSFAYRRKFLNRRLRVLMEARSKDNHGSCEGHTDNYIKVLVKTKLDLKNQVISVKIKKVNKNNDFCEANLCG